MNWYSNPKFRRIAFLIISTPVWVLTSYGFVQAANGLQIVPLDTQGDFLTEYDDSTALAWGDVDNDGDLDIVIGNSWGQKDALFLNVNGQIGDTPAWVSEQANTETSSVAWGDIDNDGYLDLAIGRHGQNVLYRNNNGELEASPGWFSLDSRITTSIAWGDSDNDGDLDLAAGNRGGTSGSGDKNVIYKNDNGILVAGGWTSIEEDHTTSIGWGDVDSDGDLDLAVGNRSNYRTIGAPNRIYFNLAAQGGIFRRIADWSSLEEDHTSSVEFGDIDNDGDLDLAIGNYKDFTSSITATDKIYLNNNGILETLASWESSEDLDTAAISFGDIDGDGDFDLGVAGKHGSRVYANDDGEFQSTAQWLPNEPYASTDLIFVDANNNGLLDLAVSSSGHPSRIYRNLGSPVNFDLVWESSDSTYSQSIAWGDIDNDGDPDLAVANGYEDDVGFEPHEGNKKNEVYLNNNGTIADVPYWSSSRNYMTGAVAWADNDGDGDLDLSFSGEATYENDNGNLLPPPFWPQRYDLDGTSRTIWGDIDGDGELGRATSINSPTFPDYYHITADGGWQSNEADPVFDVALGDYDNDGDLELAAATFEGTRVYFNNNGQLSEFASWEINKEGIWGWPTAVAWGDIDGDSDLELAIGRGRVRIYSTENGSLSNTPIWSSANTGGIRRIVWVDIDVDGDMDLLIGKSAGNIEIFYNQGDTFPDLPSYTLDTGLIPDPNLLHNLLDIDIADMDNDGDIDLALSSATYNQVYANNFANNKEQVRIKQVGTDSLLGTGLDKLSVETILENSTIPVTYELFGNGKDIKFKEVVAYYSLNGGGSWSKAVPTSNTQTTSLLSDATQSVEHTYNWDLFASGIFGLNDNVTLRLVALPECANSCELAAITTHTTPFRVRGAQIRTIDPAGEPIGNALVYRLPPSASRDAKLISNGIDEAFKTSKAGYLQGRGELANGDKFVALQPVIETENYTLYHTSADPVVEGLDMDVVTQFGVQELIISPDNPLILYNLDVSLEWDGRRDTRYLEQLEFDLLRTSELLYDWSNGQAALGNVTIYHAKEKWDDADIRIHATNRQRPHATIGGVVSGGLYHEVTVNGTAETLLYTPGHVAMGATWNRYGEAGDSLSEDWARTLAHELGHYLFFLFDNYIGIQNNAVTRIEGCPGVMSDPYSDVDSEFHPTTNWVQNCADTLSQQMLGQSDWETIVDFYPWLNAPIGAIDDVAETGPNTLPLAVTQIEYVEPSADVTTVDVNTIFLTQPDGSPYVAGSSARAFLFHGDAMMDLGTPRRDRVRAWNASPGDTLCVYELTNDVQIAGCDTVTQGDTEMTLSSASAWQPDVIVSPLSRSQIEVVVENLPAGLSLNARLYPANMLADEAAPPAIALTQQTDGSYSATLTTDQLTQEAYLRIDDNNNPNNIVVADYTIGGAPVLSLSSGDTLSLSSGDVLTLSSGGTVQLSDGDVLSLSSGDVIVFKSDGTALSLSSGDVLTLSSGGTLTLSSGDVLSLSSGDTLSLSSGDVTITSLDGTALSLSSGDTLSLSSGDTLTLSSGDVLSLSSGDTLSLSSGDVVMLIDGTVLSLSSGDVLSLSSGSTLSLSSGGTLSLSSGDALSLSSGDVSITQINGETLSLSSGDVLSLSSGGTLSLSSGGTLSLSSGDTLSLSSGDAFITQLDGTVLSLSSGDVLSLSSGGTLSLSSGDTLSLSSGGVLSLSSGDVQLVGVGDVLSLSSGSAPVRSGDGQVTLYTDHRNFAPGEFYTIQPATSMPDALSWTTAIGQAYRITASPNAPDLSQASISINYLGRSIDDDRENLLHVYFYDGTTWAELATDVDEYHNRAVAAAQGPGIYALMYTIDVPLANTGWNLIAYPLNQPSPVPDVLASIDGVYSTVYGYDAFEADQFQRWEIYDTASPAWVNDLVELIPGRGYWINANANATLKLRDISAAAVTAAASTPSVPPATYYGQIITQESFDLSADMLIQAWIGDVLCGQGQTKEVDGQIVYVVTVYADGNGSIQGCGESGDTVRFTLDGQALPASNALWDSESVHEHDLTVGDDNLREQYLPFVSQ